MTQRQIILDTETTGLRIEDGHRIIELACLEMVNRKLTGKTFHRYLNPGREVEAGALAVHGISNEFLQDKPTFDLIVNDLMDFVTGAELIIHNAPFDLSFLNNELTLLNQHWKKLNEYCRIIDTLQLARQLHAGQKNNLDALCKRYKVDNSKRDLHGAMLDANLLAKVYLGMTGGQGSFFDSIHSTSTTPTKTKQASVSQTHHFNLIVLKANEAEINSHEEYLKILEKQGKCVWTEEK